MKQAPAATNNLQSFRNNAFDLPPHAVSKAISAGGVLANQHHQNSFAYLHEDTLPYAYEPTLTVAEQRPSPFERCGEVQYREYDCRRYGSFEYSFLPPRGMDGTPGAYYDPYDYRTSRKY